MNIWHRIQQERLEKKHSALGSADSTAAEPFFCVAPMADVTDAAFRQVIAKYSRHGEQGGGPDVMWTEFVSANGLMSKGREVLQRDLAYAELERPIIAQLFSSDPEKMEQAAQFVAGLGFDGIDINMGCPDRTIEKQGAGACMITTPDAALAVIAAAKRGIANSLTVQNGGSVGLSVKTRVGYNQVEIDTWIPMLLQSGIDALTVHARTRKELSKVPAQWAHLKKVVALRDTLAPDVLIIGNGDVISRADGIAKAALSGVDGVMVGRALFGNPWFFDAKRDIVAALPEKRSAAVRWLARVFGTHGWITAETKRQAAQSTISPITVRERLEVLVEHTELYESLLGDTKSFAVMKKHYKAYCTGFPGAKELRLQLMETQSAAEVSALVSAFLAQN